MTTPPSDLDRILNLLMAAEQYITMIRDGERLPPRPGDSPSAPVLRLIPGGAGS